MTFPNAYPVQLVSFGFLHDGPPADADLVVDARRFLRDPAAIRELLDSDGRDPAVSRVVLRTRGAQATLTALERFVAGFPADRPCVVAIGCAGGRHRSVALVEALAAQLTRRLPVQVEHRHVHLPRVVDRPDDRLAERAVAMAG